MRPRTHHRIPHRVSSRLTRSLAAICAALALAPVAAAQRAEHQPARAPALSEFGSASQVIVPQSRAFPLGNFGQAVVLESVTARVRILEQTASTTLEIALRNPGRQRVEAILLLPVPDDAAVSSFMFDGESAEPTARVLARDEARRVYDRIVARIRDPALLEFAGYNLVRSSVFPVEAGAVQKLRLTYEHLLSADGDRIDYVLPRSESLQQPCPWNVAVDIQSSVPIAAVYSPTHELISQRLSPRRASVRLNDAARTQPGPFRLSYLVQRDGVPASMFTYPDPETGGGYFLLMAGVPVDLDHLPTRRREVTIVIDRSGSMAGEKMDQVRAAALQVIEGLDRGESFNIIDYATNVSLFSSRAVVKDRVSTRAARRYLASIRPRGGTNIHDALVEALSRRPAAETLPIVLFLTDGLPTIGQTSETAIRDAAANANVYHRRIFTFGVGADVNVPLLDRIADATKAVATYVLPGEDVELKVARTFKRLDGPVLSDLALRTLDTSGEETTRRVRDIMPPYLPDLFADDQLIVLGRYLGNEPLMFELSGEFGDRRRVFRFTFSLDNATTRNAFVPRLWASRRIAYLVDEVRQAGADASSPTAGWIDIFSDPRYQEIADEILHLSTRFGVLTEYTAFLATEGTDLGDWSELQTRCNRNLDQRAVQTRSGAAAVNQGVNFNRQKLAAQIDYQNRYVDEKLNRVTIGNVQQVCDRAFFKRGARWIDGEVVAQQEQAQPDVVIEFGSEAHQRLLARLLRENRQAVLSLRGEIVLRIDDRNVLIRNGGETTGE
jgi:Ca-activated chloride channel family protein